MVSIADACELVTDGTHYTPKDLGRGIPFLTVRDVSDAILDFTNCSFISESDYLAAKAGNSAPKNGDVLFSKDGTVGKVHVVRTNQPFAVLSSLAILRPKRDHVDPGYLGHVLRSPSVLDDALKKKTGSAIRRIVLGDLKRVRLPLPPLPEQRRIAAILDQAETLRTQRRTALAQLDSLTQSIFLDMFGDPVSGKSDWPKVRLGDLAADVQIGPFGSLLHQEDYVEGGVPLINPMHIKLGRLEPDSSQSITKSKHAQLSMYHLRTGDVVMGRRGEMGRCAVVSEDLDGLLCGTGSLFVRPDQTRATSQYLFAVLTHSSMKSHLESISLGATMPNLNKGIVAGLQINVPPLPTQQTFATRIQAIEALKAKHRASLAELDALFASLQHRAFNGELTARAKAAQPQPRRFAELGQLDASKGLEALVYAARRLPGKGHYWPLKAQYVADKHHLERHGKTIYGETHMAMPYGPVPQAAYNASRALAQGELICEFPMDAVRTALRRDGDDLVALRDADASVLGEHERESLDWAIRLVADLSFEELKTQTHDAAWKKTAPNEALAWRDIIESLAPAVRRRLLEQFE